LYMCILGLSMSYRCQLITDLIRRLDDALLGIGRDARTRHLVENQRHARLRYTRDARDVRHRRSRTFALVASHSLTPRHLPNSYVPGRSQWAPPVHDVASRSSILLDC